MKLKLTSLTFFIFISLHTFSQENSTIIFGEISSSNIPLKDVHVINLNTSLGTISNSNGEFEIEVSKNDVLLISSIQYNHLKISITAVVLKDKKINIILTPIVNELDEVFLNGLTGDISNDISKVPKDTIPHHSFVFKRSDVLKIGPDYSTNFSKAPNAERLTNPVLMNGVGGSATIPNFQLIAEQKLKRELAKKKNFPTKLKRELGTDFFIKNLKIPEEKIDNFISYCENRDILSKYYSNRVLEVIEILKEESNTYNEIKN